MAGHNFPCWLVDTTVQSPCEQFMLLSLQAKSVSCAPLAWF